MIRYMVIRIEDERSSDICKAIEAYALSRGGLRFPFSFGGYYYDSNTLNRGLTTYGETYTHVFHEHCRCSLVPMTEEAVWKHKQPDSLDVMMMIDSAVSPAAEDLVRDQVTETSARKFKENKILAFLKLHISNFFRRFPFGKRGVD